MECQVPLRHTAYGPLPSHEALEVGPDVDRAVLVAVEGGFAVSFLATSSKNPRAGLEPAIPRLEVLCVSNYANGGGTFDSSRFRSGKPEGTRS